MSPDEIERHINKICWGGQFAFVKNEDGESLTIIIKSLSLKDKNFVDFVYEEYLKEAEAEGVPTKLELHHELKLKGLWSENEDKKIKTLRERVLIIQKDIKGIVKGSRAHRITDALLGSLKNQLADLLVRRRSLFAMSREDYAEENKNGAVVFGSTYNDDDTKYWPTYESFLNEKDGVFIENIVNEMNKGDSLSVKQIRCIARSPIWRFRWSAGKSHGRLFSTHLLDLNINQQSLVYWSQVYDSVYDSHERPDDDIIDDDDKLDKWFESREKERKKEKALDGKNVKGVKLSSRISQHGEIFVVANPEMNPDAPKIQDIEGLNPEYVRKFKQKEQELIKKKGTINEKDLRSRRNRLARKIIGSKAAVLGKSSFGKSRGGKGAKRIVPGENIG